MQATPLQLAQATALMATRGKWIRPPGAQHRWRAAGGSGAAAGYPAARSALLGLRDPWHGAGTARRPGYGAEGRRSSVYRIAGKSGTAQVVAIRQGEKYDSAKLAERHRDHALFVAFAPVHDPKIAVAVMVENGESGSGVAAPVAKQVMDAWLLDEEGKLKAEFAPPLTAEGKKP